MRKPRKRAGAADAAHDRIDVVIHLLPDLGAGRGLVGHRVGGIAELVHEERARLGRDLLREILVVVGMPLAHIGARHHDIRAHGLQMKDLLAAHLVGNHEDELVALARGDKCQAEAGVARGRFDDGAAGFQRSVALGGLDHRKPDAVLDRAAGILVLELEEEPARSRVDPRHRYQRRVADEREDRVGAGDVHGHSRCTREDDTNR